MLGIRSVFVVLVICVFRMGAANADSSSNASQAWFKAHGCASTFPAAKANLATQYNFCRGGVSGCSETCITQYAQGLSQLDCAAPPDMQDVVDACTASCPGSPLCSNTTLLCAYPLTGHSCDNYVTCVNKVVPCGDDGYALGFGDRYCTAYLAEDSTFSTHGQEWALQVRRCLQRQFVNQNISSMTCQQISDFAIGTHFGCYQGPPSYCSLSVRDKYLVSITAAPALLSSRFFPIFEQAIQINVVCWFPSIDSALGEINMPHLLTLRVTWNIPQQAIMTTLNDTQLHDTVMSFIQRVESAVITQFPSLPSNGTILFGTMGGTSNTTTLDIMISMDPNAAATPVNVDIYAVATYVQQHLINGDIGASPYGIANVQSLTPIPTTAPKPTGNNPNTSSTTATTTIAIMLALIAAVHVGLQ